MVAAPVLANADVLPQIINDSIKNRGDVQIDFDTWFTSGYQPTPTIAEAAQHSISNTGSRRSHARMRAPKILARQPTASRRSSNGRRLQEGSRFGPETQTRDLPAFGLTGKESRAMEPGHHAGDHETLPLGRASFGCAGQLHGVDAGQPAPSTCLPRIAVESGLNRPSKRRCSVL
jgi:hypothetical protein